MELPHIGEACVICNRNDYLPFKCAYCSKIVCIDHKANHGSDCPLTKSSFHIDNIEPRPSESIRKACDFCRKITLQLELSRCAHCGREHCLYHRHQVQHACTKLAVDEEARRKEGEAKAQRQQEALDKLRSVQSATPARKLQSAVPPRQLDPKKLALARRVNIMRIKQSARGPPNVLDQDKLYFEVEFDHNPSCPFSNECKQGKNLAIYATRKHPLGRLVDFSAHELDITNKNHILHSEQLVFKVPVKDTSQLVVLDNQATFQKYIETGLLDSGDKLLMTHQKLVENSNR